MGFAREVADRIVFMEKGNIVEEGSPDDLFYRPKFERTREFLWKITELYGKKENADGPSAAEDTESNQPAAEENA